jgi:hypothetical protein
VEVTVKKLASISSALVALAVLLPAAALAKGASEATITGPGLDRPVTLPGEGQPGGEQLMELAQEAGFFSAVFRQTPDPMLDSRPSGALGPQYTVRYEMPGPNNELDVLVQEVYPFAQPSPVTFTEPGQRFWTTEETRGGWFVASDVLRTSLVGAGIPETAPRDTDGGDSGWPVVGVLAAVVAAIAAALALVTRWRRRRTRVRADAPQTSTVTASRSAS